MLPIVRRAPPGVRDTSAKLHAEHRNNFQPRLVDITSQEKESLCQIEVRSGNEVHYRGEVRDSAPGLGTIWLRGEDGLRIAVSVEDFTIWKVPA